MRGAANRLFAISYYFEWYFAGRYFARLSVLIIFLIFPPLSWSSTLKDHSSITEEAITAFQLCFPKKISRFSREVLVFSNLSEDLNLVRKWIRYSHYYHPEKDLSTWRGSSMDRISDSQTYLTYWKNNLTTNSSFMGVHEAINRLGNVIHHIQDSTVPSHVIPVNHWMSDAFERYSGELSTVAVNCSEIVSAIPPSELLKESAYETLTSLKNSFPATISSKDGSKEVQLNWDYFWFDTKDRFGSYGYLGNNFGKTKILRNDGTYEIASETYRKFWQERRNQSVKRTAQALYWFFGNLINKKSLRTTVQESSDFLLEDLIFEKN